MKEIGKLTMTAGARQSPGRGMDAGWMPWLLLPVVELRFAGFLLNRRPALGSLKCQHAANPCHWGPAWQHLALESIVRLVPLPNRTLPYY